MRYFSYVEPGDDDLSVIKVVMSEEEILASYWEYWCSRMKEVGHADLINQETCIEDWCTVHWATPEDIFRFRSGYPDKIFCINEFNTLDPHFEWATVVCLNDPSVKINGYVNVVTQMEKVNV
jgi:hypothetical protein